MRSFLIMNNYKKIKKPPTRTAFFCYPRILYKITIPMVIYTNQRGNLCYYNIVFTFPLSNSTNSHELQKRAVRFLLRKGLFESNQMTVIKAETHGFSNIKSWLCRSFQPLPRPPAAAQMGTASLSHFINNHK